MHKKGNNSYTLRFWIFLKFSGMVDLILSFNFQVTFFFSYEAYFLRYYQKTWFLPIVLFLVTAATLCKISIKKTHTLEPTHWETFLTNFSIIRSVVIREEDFWKKLMSDRRRTTTDAKWWQKLTLPSARWAQKTCGSITAFQNANYTNMINFHWIGQ